MFRYLTLILVLCAFFFIGMLKSAESYEFERNEALQMHNIENAYTAIEKSKKERELFKNQRSLASNGHQKEFESLMEEDGKEHYFDEIDGLE